MTSASILEIGSVVEGTVSGITRFGAFIALPNGQTGLVHISEVADAYVQEVTEFIQENDKVTVKVLSRDPSGKVALSLKQADPNYRASAPRSKDRWSSGGSFEEKLSKFLKDSDDKQSDLRRIEGKRGGRGGRHE